ncbi:hypothetical protein CDD83_2901 [Cordyceps sp. RAO-2017]|nr:hypothetical protein CDD83_2901 [Cordyceps sp. RAO-2017]
MFDDPTEDLMIRDFNVETHPSSATSHCQRLRGPGQPFIPIWNSQPFMRRQVPSLLTSTCSSHFENRLRRKTPSGTVDAGYDGAPTQASHGPPPLKHTILTAISDLNSDTLPLRDLVHNSLYEVRPSDQSIPDRWLAPRWSSSDRTTPHFGISQIYHGDLISSVPNFSLNISRHGQEASRPVMRYNEDNPSLWPRDSRSPDQAKAVTFCRDQQDDTIAIQPVLDHLMGQPSFKYISGVSSICPAASPSSRPGFKEKTVDRAHECYVDLLAFQQANRRLNLLKTSSGSEAVCKYVAYPKSCGERLRLFQLTSGIGVTDNRGSVLAATLPVDQVLSKAGYGCFSQQKGLAESNSLGTASPRLAIHQGPARLPMYPPSTIAPPLANAMSSLEHLSRLCELSGWKWLDGILMGGCLQYGLERYEVALNWFSKILELDASHVEAITNMAITLFSLNRQREAEQYWLRAVKLHPSYLEATEHLVGLLYKKRSQEAVELITYVQQVLTNPLQVSHDRRVGAECKEYGSSGYAIPASENGRMLSLIHVKGTMLYSLKDVEKASEAFEEAVMISVGRRFRGIFHLIHHIQVSLSFRDLSAASADGMDQHLHPPMLPPDRARRTAQLVFAGAGELPGLVSIRHGASRRAAIQTTSNSLLSLAKIFQDTISNGGVNHALSRRSPSVADILALYYLSLSLQESPSTANNVGILLAGIHQAIPRPPKAVEKDDSQLNVPGIIPGTGMALALAYYNYGLQLDPKHVHLHTNLGSLLKDIGQLDLAIQLYERAVSCDGTFDIALTNLANAVKDKGRINEAITYYRRAVRSNPNFAEAVCGLFTALNSICSWRGRGGVILASGRWDRWHVDDEGRLLDALASDGGSGLARRVVDIVAQQLHTASLWGRHVLKDPVIRVLVEQLRHLCEDVSFQLDDAVRQWIGTSWEGSRITRLVERATRVALRRLYLDLHVDVHVDGEPSKVSCARPRLPAGLTVPVAPTVLPFHTFTCPLNAAEIRLIAQRNALRISCSTLQSSWLPPAVPAPPPPPSPQLNVGYLSSDFNNHPLAHLMQSVFGFHDPKRVRAFCYATTASDRSVHRQKIEREAPMFRDVSGWPPERLVAQIAQDHIHILVNLNGYTRGARNEVFAARSAPIQMSFMGFAGTLGAEWCDYILADTTAVPHATLRPWRRNVSIEDIFRDNTEDDEGEWVYSENIIFCRDTFFCCDHAQSCGSDEKHLTWEDEKRRRWTMRKELFPSLADETVILGNFNQLYKIEPTTFRSWLRILARVSNAVLWLLRFPDPGESNLRATAEAWAGPEVASRLIFTDVAPKNQHISRARVCDLFLDTPECNAHTTAADVLWSSTPLLTLPRYPYKMCSRMAASILRGALPLSPEGQKVARELIVEDERQYEQHAVELAGLLVQAETSGREFREGRGRLAEIRQLLWDNKWRCGLFNTRRWVKDIESAYIKAWQRWVEGSGGDIYL